MIKNWLENIKEIGRNPSFKEIIKGFWVILIISIIISIPLKWFTGISLSSIVWLTFIAILVELKTGIDSKGSEISRLFNRLGLMCVSAAIFVFCKVVVFGWIFGLSFSVGYQAQHLSGGFIKTIKQLQIPLVLIADLITTALAAFMCWSFYTDFKHQFRGKTWKWRPITIGCVVFGAMMVWLNYVLPGTMQTISKLAVDASLANIARYFVKGFEPLSQGKDLSPIFLSQVGIIFVVCLGFFFKKTRVATACIFAAFIFLISTLYLAFGISLTDLHRQEKVMIVQLNPGWNDTGIYPDKKMKIDVDIGGVPNTVDFQFKLGSSGVLVDTPTYFFAKGSKWFSTDFPKGNPWKQNWLLWSSASCRVPITIR